MPPKKFQYHPMPHHYKPKKQKEKPTPGVESTAELIRRYCTVDAHAFLGLTKEPSAQLSALELKLYPPLAEFIGFGGASKHVVTNCGSHRLVFKVKCSNNALFKVAPVFAFLDPGMSVDLQVVRLEGPIRKDKLLIMFKEAKPGERDAKRAFGAEGVTGKTILPLITREIDEY